MQSAAAALALADAVLAHAGPSPAPAAFSLARPPGHHVLASRPMGFGCINIISCVAKHALQQPGVHKVS